MLPAWALTLAHLYWRLRMTRAGGRPTRRTWWRRIATEKKRLLAAGVPMIELHLVTRLLANPHSQAAARRWRQYLEARARGTSPWP